uniref:Putative transposase n=1 Tax=viral metagenome TaxID=1070528 RepID=A0A6M3KIJ7_9ZZZZ
MLKKTFKYRLYPTVKQKKSLQISLDACRWVYNKTLEVRKKTWEEEKKSLSLYDTNSLLVQWKKDKSDLANAFSQCLQNAQLKVDLAFKAFFRRVKVGENPGYPRFRGVDRYDSFTFPQSGFSLMDNRLKLSKVGSVKIRKHRNIEGIIKTLTIRRTATGKWYACFSCIIEANPLPKIDTVVGIDVGLESFATLSTGEKIPNPRFFKTNEKKLVKAQRKLSKAEKGTPERKKVKKVIAYIHERIINKRSDFAHKLSLNLTRRFQVIAFEKLNIKEMRENSFKGIRKSIGDVAWNQFIQFTAYKAEGAGRTVMYVDPKNTSKRCSRCGQSVEKKLSDRIHFCSCGLILDRDENAAINILSLGLKTLGLAPRSRLL